MTGVTQEDVQREREEVLAANTEQIRKSAEMVKAILENGYVCALGSEEKVKSASELFETIRVLN